MAQNTPSEMIEQIAGGNLPKENAKELARRIDQNFREQKARKESAFLSKASQWIVSAWEIMQLVAQLKPGQVLVVDSDGNIRRGIMSQERREKFALLPQKVSKRIPSNLDGAENEYGKFLRGKTADDVPGIGTGFSHEWISTVRRIKNAAENPLVDIIMELCELNRDKVRYEIQDKGMAGTFQTIWVEGISLKITVNQFGRLIRYETAQDVWENA